MSTAIFLGGNSCMLLDGRPHLIKGWTHWNIGGHTGVLRNLTEGMTKVIIGTVTLARQEKQIYNQTSL